MAQIRLDTRVTFLTKLHGVAQKNVMGAYDTKPLRELEFLFHEVAHWLVLGNPTEKVPHRLSLKIQAVMDRIPQASADSLEIDASLVTFLAGYKLGLWADPSPIIRSCRRNLRGILALGNDDAVEELFRKRLQASRRDYDVMSSKLAKWFRPTAKLVPVPGTIGV